MNLLHKAKFALAAIISTVGCQSMLSAAPLPAPFDALGPQFLTFTGGVSAAYNSNVLSAPSNKLEDYIFTFNPGVRLDYGKNDEIGDTTVTYSETFLRYAKHTALNEELSNLALNYVKVQSRFTFSLAASYGQSYSNTPSSAGAGLTSIIRTDNLGASGDVHWNFSDKFNFDAALQFAQAHYLYTVGKAFQDTDTYTIPATAYYVYSPALSLGVGYTYQQTDPKSSTGGQGRERESHAFTLNALLTEWQKLTGSANVGLTESRIEGSTAPAAPSLTSTTVSYGVNFSYAYSPKIALTVAGNRGFSTGTQGQNIETTSGGVGANYSYSDTINVQANLLNYTYSQYLQSARNDDTYTSGITVNWLPYNWLTLSAGYTYFMNSSSQAGATYNINVITLSGTIKY